MKFRLFLFPFVGRVFSDPPESGCKRSDRLQRRRLSEVCVTFSQFIVAQDKSHSSGISPPDKKMLLSNKYFVVM